MKHVDGRRWWVDVLLLLFLIGVILMIVYALPRPGWSAERRLPVVSSLDSEADNPTPCPVYRLIVEHVPPNTVVIGRELDCGTYRCVMEQFFTRVEEDQLQPWPRRPLPIKCLWNLDRVCDAYCAAFAPRTTVGPVLPVPPPPVAP